MIDRTKVTDEMQVRGNFTLTPNELWSKKGISQDAKVLFGYLMSHTQGWTPGIRSILQDIGMTQYKFQKAVAELDSMDMLSVSNESTKRNVYILNPPSKWVPLAKDTVLVANTKIVSVANAHTKQSTKQNIIKESKENSYTDRSISNTNYFNDHKDELAKYGL